MKEPPKRIWLQVEEDGEPFDEGQVTWCQDRINTSDVEYVKLSELPTEEEIWRPAMKIFSKRVDKFFEESPMHGPTKAQLYGAWHESFEAITKLIKGEK